MPEFRAYLSEKGRARHLSLSKPWEFHPLEVTPGIRNPEVSGDPTVFFPDKTGLKKKQIRTELKSIIMPEAFFSPYSKDCPGRVPDWMNHLFLIRM
jgi:hypothetical protein